MAGESLGTMVVGVTADITPAERALTSMANMLERFERQNQARQRQAVPRKPSSVGLIGYGPFTEEQIFAEMLRKEQVQQQAISQWVQRDIRSSEKAAVTSRAIEPHMSGLADEFRKRQQQEISALQVEAEKLLTAEKKKADRLIAEGERLNTNMSNLAMDFRQRQQRDIDELQVMAEKLLRMESKKNNALIAEGERLNSNMRNLAIEFRQRQQQDIDSLQVQAEKEIRIEKRKADERIANGERLNANMANLAMEFRQRQQREEQLAIQAGKALDDHMKELGRQFRAGMFDSGDEGIAPSAAKARFAVMNLAYGVQDFAQTIGTGGFPAAVRASANNLTGLAVLFDKTAYASGGLKAALMTPEVAVIAVATGALFAADAIEKYQKSLAKAAAESAKAQFARFDVGEAGQIGERQARFKEDLALAKNLADAQKVVDQKQRDDRVAAERESREKTVAQQARDMLEAEKKVEALRKQFGTAKMRVDDLDKMGPAAQQFFKDLEKAQSANELELRAKILEGKAKVKDAEEAVNKTIGERIQLLKELDAAERNLRRAKRDDVEDRFNKAFAENIREGQRNEEDRIRIGRRDFAESVRKMESDVMDLERKARFDPFAGTGAAGRNTAAEYEALVRARAPAGADVGELAAMKQLLQEQKEILRKIEENTKETYEGPPPTVDELINGV